VEARGRAGEGIVSRLQSIVESKHRELRALGSVEVVRDRVPLDVVGALRRGPGEPLRLLTEVKLRSPSAGTLSRVLSAPDRALVYATSGAAMVSVLCDAPFFDGSWDHLAGARRRIDEAGLRVPLLAKEFVVASVQIDLAYRSGADSVLLIKRIVDDGQLRTFVLKARSLGLEPLVEVVDEQELGAALEAGARIVGVNARDLDTLAMDAERAARVLEAIPKDVISVHLSGLKRAEDVARVARTKADAALVGEALMREDDPRGVLAEMVGACGGG
jgi:indole-3-glycerol phosphate synthase